MQNVAVEQSIHAGQFRLTWEFIDGSEAVGVLIIAYSMNNDSDISYNVIARLSNGTQEQTTTISGLKGRDYNISIFVQHANGRGLPFPRAVAEPTTVTILREKG